MKSQANASAIPLHCYKMHGLGNDYIYFFKEELNDDINLSSLAREVSDRHRGVGSDGMVLISPGRDGADFDMRIWNADGSEAQMCGNASRCVGLLLYLKGLTAKHDLKLSTLSGIKLLHLNFNQNGEIESITVDMGVPVLNPRQIPVDESRVGGDPPSLWIKTVQGELTLIPVSMGNPHGVCFLNESPTDKYVLGLGPLLEVDSAWPEKANIEFAHCIDRKNITMRVWERGSGETMACGTGACATAVAAILSGRTENKVNIHLPGGTLKIEWRQSDSHVLMTGAASLVANIQYYSFVAAGNGKHVSLSTNI